MVDENVESRGSQEPNAVFLPSTDVQGSLIRVCNYFTVHNYHKQEVELGLQLI